MSSHCPPKFIQLLLGSFGKDHEHRAEQSNLIWDYFFRARQREANETTQQAEKGSHSGEEKTTT